MSQFNGMRQLAAQVASRPLQDELVSQNEQRRILAARNQQALLDKRVAEAAMAAREDQYQAALQRMLDLNDPNNVAILAGLTGGMKDTAQTRGYEFENDVRAQALEQLRAGTLDADTQNALMALTGEKLLGPSNVKVSDQAQADIDATRAMERARNRSNQPGTSSPSPTRGKALSTNDLMALLNGPERVNDFYMFRADMEAQGKTYNRPADALADYTSTFKDGSLYAEAKAAEALNGAAAAAIPTPVPEGELGSATNPVPSLDDWDGESPPPVGTWFIIDGVPAQYNPQGQ